MDSVEQVSAPDVDIPKLVAFAVAHFDDPVADDDDDGPAWKAIWALRQDGSRAVLDAAAALCRSRLPSERSVGACILGQLGHRIGMGVLPFANERFDLLSGLLARELNGAAQAGVLVDTCFALGHLHDPRSIPLVLPLKSHAVERVRLSVVHALSGHEDDDAVSAMIDLSDDASGDIRDWATFGLGTLIDSARKDLCDALRARISDIHIDTRHEAIFGLARRQDGAALETVVLALIKDEVSPLLLDAATELADPQLCNALSAAKSSTWNDRLLRPWTEAMAACGCVAA